MKRWKEMGLFETQLLNSERANLRALCDKSNAELLELMDVLSEEPYDISDRELFDAAEQLLEERAPIGPVDEPEAALKEFWERNADLLVEPQEDEIHEQKNGVNYIWGRIINSKAYRGVAAVALLLLALNIFALATGQDPMKPLLDLRETLVRYVTQGPSGRLELPENASSYKSLEEALAATGHEDAQLLEWIPSDLSLSNVEAIQDPVVPEIYDYWAYYASENKDLLFHIKVNMSEVRAYYDEKDPEEQPFVINGVTYQLMTNMDTEKAGWDIGRFSYTISGTITREEMIYILKSIK